MFESPDQLDPQVRAAYLRRLGVEAGPPSADLLTLLVRRQAERVPYETLWIAARGRWSIDPVQAAWRIAFGALADIFDLRFETTPPESRQRLWVKALDAHRTWQARQHL